MFGDTIDSIPRLLLVFEILLGQMSTADGSKQNILRVRVYDPNNPPWLDPEYRLRPWQMIINRYDKTTSHPPDATQAGHPVTSGTSNQINQSTIQARQQLTAKECLFRPLLTVSYTGTASLMTVSPKVWRLRSGKEKSSLEVVYSNESDYECYECDQSA